MCKDIRKNIIKKIYTFNKIPISFGIRGACFKASGHFPHYFFSSYPTKMYVPVYISYGPMVISRAYKIYVY